MFAFQIRRNLAENVNNSEQILPSEPERNNIITKDVTCMSLSKDSNESFQTLEQILCQSNHDQYIFCDNLY